MNGRVENELNQLFSIWDNKLCPGAQILIRQHGKTIYENCFGYGNIEHKVKINKNSIFHVASISKEFTVLAILLLWKDGKLNLDDDIRTYIDEYIHIESAITIRQMMNNVSGLRDQWELLFLRGITLNDKITMEDINTTIHLQKKLNFEPQSDYLYSNTGFHLLALIVEKISKMSFPQFAQERIFKPLDMNHTHIRESFSEIVPNFVFSYQDDGDGNYYYNPLSYALYGPTSVNTCASDLCKILDEYIQPNVIDPEIIEIMKSPAVLKNGKTIEYCGGLMTHKLHDLDVFGHGGADAAYRGQISCVPEKELEIIILSNTTSRAMSKLADKAACIVLGLSDCTEPAIPTHTNISAKSGLYLTKSPDDPLLIEITECNGKFFLKKEWCNTELIPFSDDGYQVGTLDEFLYFTENGILYRMPNRIVHLVSARPADPSIFEEGMYYNDETDSYLSIIKAEDNCMLHILRYGKATIYSNSDHDMIFGFDPNFTMYIKPVNNTLILDGYRIKNMIFKKQD